MQIFAKNVFMAFVMLCFGTTVMAQNTVFINEFTPDPTMNDGSGGEWIELYNSSATAVNIGCWVVSDGQGTITIPAGTMIGGNDYFLIAKASLFNCATCDFRNLPLVIGDTNPATVEIDLDMATCGCLSGSLSSGVVVLGAAGNGGELVLLYNPSVSVTTPIDALKFDNGAGAYLPSGGNISNPSFGTCAAQVVTIPAPAGVTINTGAIIKGCNTSYRRATDGGSWETYLAEDATNENHPTPGAPNAGGRTAAYDFEYSTDGGVTWIALLKTGTQNLALCNKTTIRFRTTVRNFQHVLTTQTDNVGLFGSYFNNNGTIGAWTNVQTGGPNASGVTVFSTNNITLTPSASYSLQWSDYKEGCCGSSSPTSTNECYERVKVNVTNVLPMAATKVAVTCPADFTAGSINLGTLLSGGSAVTYQLKDNGVNVGAASTTGVFTILNSLTGPITAVVTDASGCTAPITVSINNACRSAPICPTLFINSTTSSPIGATNTCPSSTVTLCPNNTTSTNIAGRTLEWYRGTTAAFDPYTAPASDLMCSKLMEKTCPTAAQAIVINEMGVAPTTGDAAGGGEFIELFNTSDCAIDLSCFVLTYTAASGGTPPNPTGWTVRFPSGKTIAPCGYFVIGGTSSIGGTTGTTWKTSSSGAQNLFSGGAADIDLGQSTSRALCTFNNNSQPGNLSNAGGQVSLLDGNLSLVTSVYYGPAPPTTAAPAYPITIAAPAGCAGTTITTLPSTSPNTLTTISPAFNGTTGSHYINLNSASAYITTSGTTTGAVGSPGAANTSQKACIPAPLLPNCCVIEIPETECNNGGNLFFKGIIKPIDVSCIKANATTAAAGPYTVTCPVATMTSVVNCVAGVPSATITTDCPTCPAGTAFVNFTRNAVVASAMLTFPASNTFTTTASGDYALVNVLPASGCKAKGNSTFTLTVPPAPVTGSIAGGGNVCENLAVVLTANGGVASNYEWSLDNFATTAAMGVDYGTTAPAAGATTTVYARAINGPCAGAITSATVTGINCAIAPLPVTLTAFTATKQNTAIALNWRTETELNNNYFEVQRSADGSNFITIGTVRGAGTTNVAQKYNLIDTKPLRGINYYRLNQVDFDGKQAFSPTVSVSMNDKVIVDIMPNPAYNSVNIAISGENSTASVRIADATGRVLSAVDNISNNQSIDISQLPQGVYFMQISVDKQTYVRRLVKM